MASITQLPGTLNFEGIGGYAFTVVLNVTLTDSHGNPLPFADLSNPTATVFSNGLQLIAADEPTITVPTSGQYQLAWTAAQTQDLLNRGTNCSWQMSADVNGVNTPLLAGGINMVSATTGGASNSTTADVVVQVGTNTVSLGIELGGSAALTAFNIGDLIGTTLVGGTFNIHNSGGNGSVNLPTAPTNGTPITIRNQQANLNGALTVVPGGSDTIEGSTGMVLRTTVGGGYQTADLVYDATTAVWYIVTLDPNPFTMQLSAGGYSDAVTGQSPVTNFPLPRAASMTLVSNAASGPLNLVSGFSNIDLGITVTKYSAGMITINAIIFGLKEAPTGTTPGTNYMILKSLQVPIEIAPGAASPVYGTFDNTNDWEVWSGGSDLSLYPVSGSTSISSSAGGTYFWFLEVQYKVQGLVP